MTELHTLSEPADWVRRFLHLIPAGGTVLDLAAGRGRHARLLLDAGLGVIAADRDADRLANLPGHERLQVIEADFETEDWPFAAGLFAGIVVVNYLHRPLFGHLTDALQDGGVLIYQTFAEGNEAYGRPKNPDFLLKPGELLASFAPALSVVAYEHGIIHRPGPAVVQRLCAVKSPAPQSLGDGV
jgi:SAM-dependent methyltransferase